MEQIKILAIGNSFSEDATYYLHNIAKAGGIDTKVVNLFIGGCSIERHWRNIEQDAKLYVYEREGVPTDRYVSIREALAEEEWDFVVTQQASHDSGMHDTYYPNIFHLFDYMKRNAPKAELLLHETWAYEIDSTHECFVRYNNDQKEMYERLSKEYKQAAQLLGVRLISSGDAVQMVRTKEPFIYEKGGMSLCKDGFHMSYIYGRYILAAVWYETLFGKNILENPYMPESIFAPGQRADAAVLNMIKECVHRVVSEA